MVRLRCDLPHSSSISNPAITTSQLWHGETNRVTWRKLTSRDDEEDDENSLYNDKMTRKGWQEKINAKRATSSASSSSSDHSQEENLTPFANNGSKSSDICGFSSLTLGQITFMQQKIDYYYWGLKVGKFVKTIIFLKILCKKKCVPIEYCMKL